MHFLTIKSGETAIKQLDKDSFLTTNVNLLVICAACLSPSVKLLDGLSKSLKKSYMDTMAIGILSTKHRRTIEPK